MVPYGKRKEQNYLVDIQVSNQQTILSICSESVREIVKQALELEGQVTDEISINFVDTETICDLHAQFFDDPSPTDCITLPIDGPSPTPDPSVPHLLGELFVCPETAINYVKDENGDVYLETTLYLVHALLHLMGYEDKEDEAREEMRRAEKRHLAHLQETVGLLHA